MAEDPVTGNLQASLARNVRLKKTSYPRHMLQAQGQTLGRSGRVFVERDVAEQVWIGEDCRVVVRGEVSF